MTRTTTTASVRLRRLMPAALVAAALGASTLADPAIASARPVDVEALRLCVTKYVLNHPDEPENEGAVAACCIEAGGWWDFQKNTCMPGLDDDVERTLPPRVAPAAETTAPLEPVTPTTQTFAPGPAKQG